MIRFSFIGGTKRGFKLIENLLEKNYVPLSAVILREDEHETEKYSENISQLMLKHGIPYSVKRKLAEKDYEMLGNSGLDFVIVTGWRSMIDTKVNDFIKSGFIAAHQSLLPKYRGFAPSQWAMINGETETGITLFRINKGEVDSGKIISQRKVEIRFEDYAADVDEKAIECIKEMYLEFFENYKNGIVTFTEQVEAEATYTCKRIPEDGNIIWDQDSMNVYNFIRALAHPYPGAFSFHRDKCYSIRKARLGENNSKKFAGCIPGRVIKIYSDGIEVLCRTGTIHIEEWENKETGEISIPSDNVKSAGDTLCAFGMK